MKLIPLGNRLLVRRVKEEETMKNGLYIPDTAKEKPQEGEVVSAGPGRTTESGTLVPMNISMGDRVLFGKYSGTEIKLNGEPLLILNEEEVFGLLTEVESVTATYSGPLTEAL